MCVVECVVVVLLVGVFVVVDVLVAGLSDAHELSQIMAESKSSAVRMIGCFMIRTALLVAGFGHDNLINHHIVAFS